ncbi:GatB/YqeY domain-containing protein [Planosporangium mesophilum]|nr:GatB/YqeY domain-containing protein [Planosporangium mesophilum]NJC84120.1 GatB/YqeY domain-containing protein [Planosporangium mesophilum]
MSIEVPLRDRLRAALPAAMKARDRVAVAALRSALAAIDNAEAVAAPAVRGLAIEQTPVGVGAAETPRRVLTQAEVEEIVRTEVAEREAAARDYDRAGRPEHAERLRAEAAVLSGHLHIEIPPGSRSSPTPTG